MFYYQLVDFTLQIIYAFQFPLAAALSCEAVLATSPHVVDKLQLFLCKDLLLQQLLEVIPVQIHNPLYRERQPHLKAPEQKNKGKPKQ